MASVTRLNRSSTPPGFKTYTRAEVAKHNARTNCWIIIEDKVFKMTDWFGFHPGGDAPLAFGGQDATEVYASIHGPNVLQRYSKQLLVGHLSPSEAASTTKPIEKPSREWHDHMAPPGETSHIPTIVLCIYAALAGWSWLALRFAGAMWYSMFVYYLLGMGAFYVWHYCAHKPFTGATYIAHMRHHLEAYPATHFYGIDPDTVLNDLGSECPTFLQLLSPFKTVTMNIAHEGPLYVLMALILGGGYYCGSSIGLVIMVLMLYIVMGAVGNAFHMSFHVRNFQFEKYAWYMELRSLHYIHHLGNMCTNYSMVNLGMDGIFGSLALTDPMKWRSKSGTRDLMSKAEGTLPNGIDISRMRQHAGVSAAVLGLDIPIDVGGPQSAAVKRGYPTVLLRLILVVVGLCLWFHTEQCFSSQSGVSFYVEWPDHGHRLARPLHKFMTDSGVFEKLCTVSVLISEVSVVNMIAISVIGATFRPFLAMITAFLIRLLVISTCQLPMPIGAQFATSSYMPVLFAINRPDEFLSPRVTLATIVTTELLRWSMSHSSSTPSARRIVRLLAVCLLMFQVALTLAARTNFSYDVLFALLVGRYATLFASNYTHFVDAIMP